jgi:hypothetical protein
MKGLVRAALEKASCIERENVDLRASKELSKLDLQPQHFHCLLSSFNGTRRVGDDDELKSSILLLATELNNALAANMKLIDHAEKTRMQTTSMGVPQEDLELRAQYLKAIEEAKQFLPTISKLQAQIQAMEFDWTQAKNMRDELFDYDSKLREHEMVADALCLKRGAVSDDVKLFATSRRHMLEILVEDRNRNINGYYARRVVPLEKLRVEKDAKILELNRIIRQYEIKSGICSLELEHAKLPKILAEVCALETRCQSVTQAVEAAEEKLDALQRVVQNFEDHANEWKTAHDQASSVISRADHLRAEYNSMMAKLREEDSRILAKKKELAKLSTACNMEGQFSKLRDISEEVEKTEGDIAAAEHALTRLKDALVIKEKMLAVHKQALSQLELEIDGVTLQRADFEAFQEHRRGGVERFIVEDGDETSLKRSCVDLEETLSKGFSGVCV